MDDLWATFDCSGTLIDWYGGMGLFDIFGALRPPPTPSGLFLLDIAVLQDYENWRRARDTS